MNSVAVYELLLLPSSSSKEQIPTSDINIQVFTKVEI